MPEDNSQFENYLKRFRPLSPDDLFSAKHAAPRKLQVRWAWAVSGAAVLIVIAALANFRSHPMVDRETPSQVETYASPLTIESANATLFNSAFSPQAVLDQLAFPPSFPLPQGKISALGALGEENTGL